jgi:hypothetical protein
MGPSASSKRLRKASSSDSNLASSSALLDSKASCGGQLKPAATSPSAPAAWPTHNLGLEGLSVQSQTLPRVGGAGDVLCECRQ